MYRTREFPEFPSAIKIPVKARKTIGSNPDIGFMKVYGDTQHIDNIVGGVGSILSNQDMNASEGFDITLRNLTNPYFSSPTSITKFNNQRFSHLKNESRFKSKKSPLKKAPSPSLYDIKGNTFKNTLLPKETYQGYNTYAAASQDDFSEACEEDAISQRILF